MLWPNISPKNLQKEAKHACNYIVYLELVTCFVFAANADFISYHYRETYSKKDQLISVFYTLS